MYRVEIQFFGHKLGYFLDICSEMKRNLDPFYWIKNNLEASSNPPKYQISMTTIRKLEQYRASLKKVVVNQ